MTKKLSLLLAAVAVVAFAVPAAASATSPLLVDHTGTVLKTAKILGTSTNAVTKTSLGNLTCEKVTVTGEITQNEKTTVKGVGVGAGTSSKCFLGGTKAIEITDITLVEIHTSTVEEIEKVKVGTGTINVTFKADLPNGVTCHFSSPNMPFSYNLGTTNDSIKITEGNLLGTPAACEPGLLSGDFTLETDDGAVPPNPVWFE